MILLFLRKKFIDSKNPTKKYNPKQKHIFIKFRKKNLKIHLQ